MVLCKIDKYYNQVKFQVLWPRLKVSSSVMFTVRIVVFGFKSRRQKTSERLFEGLYLQIRTYLRVAQRVCCLPAKHS